MNDDTVVSPCLYAICDEVADDFGPPFVASSVKIAVRQFGIIMQQTPEHIRKDYSLWCLGKWDSRTAGIEYELLPVTIQVEGGK